MKITVEHDISVVMGCEHTETIVVENGYVTATKVLSTFCEIMKAMGFAEVSIGDAISELDEEYNGVT